MNLIIYNVIIIGCFVIILSSYKDNINIKEQILLYILLFAINILMRFYAYPYLEKCIYILMKIIVYYISLKLMYKDKANLIDIFYIMHLFLIYEILKAHIQDIFIIAIIVIFSLLCKKFQNNLIKLNKKIINIWNEESEKSLTLRNIYIIVFNISFYIICKLLN